MASLLAQLKHIIRDNKRISVLSDELDDNSVKTVNIKDSNVTTSKINNSAVTTEKIADGAVTIDKIATEAKTTAIVKETASDTTVPTTKAVTDYVYTESVQTVVVSGGTNNGTIKVTVDDVVTDNIAITGWNTKADEVEVERLQYYGDKDIVPSPDSYFTVNETGETITGLTDDGKANLSDTVIIPYKINNILITTLQSSDLDSILIGASNQTTKVVLPNSIINIGDGAFYSCGSLTSINIPNGVTNIGNSAFAFCGLVSINIPNGVTSIEDGTFYECRSLTSINIPNSVTSIGDQSFYECGSLVSINIPNTVTSIHHDAFSHDSFSLEGGRIPLPNLTIYCEQGSYAERYAKTNNIPVVYTDVSDIATETELERLKYYGDKDIIPSDEKYFTVNETGETITGLTEAGNTQTELVIPYKINNKLITTIETGAFYAKSIETVIIPNSIVDMHSNIFSACYSLNSINIPNGITKIEAGTFRWCRSLTTINLPNTIQTIDSSAFSGCTLLESINIPKDITQIGYNTFENCPNLTIYCEQGSYAEVYAKANNIPVVYTDISENSINKITTKLEKLIDNLYYYCNKNIVINTTCFYTEQNEEGTGNFVLNTDNLTDTTLVVPYTLYSEYWASIEGIEMTNCNITGSLNVEKIIIPRGIDFKNPVTSELWTDELLITLLPNLKTIVRIHEDGAVISYNIAESSIN